MTVTAPATATFSVVATGTAPLAYQWSSEAPGASSFTAISGATSASYTTPATTVAESGTKYEVTVSNSAGSVTSNPATLTVNAAAVAPVITTQPANATVTAPATATFSVTATGTAPLTYQWASEAPGASSFTAISGATSASYTTPATTVAQSGTKYEVVVSNSQGSVTSSAATLTVSAGRGGSGHHDAADEPVGDGAGDGDVLGGGSGIRSPTYQWSSEPPGALVVHGDQRCDVELLYDAGDHGRPSRAPSTRSW